MKVRFLGKEMEIKTELLFSMVSALVLLGVLAGIFLFGGRGDIIIEEGQAIMQQTSGNGETNDAERDGALAGNGNRADDNYGSKAMEIANADQDPGGGPGIPGNAGEDAKAGIGSNGKEDEIKVYVVGCVKNPGIVTLTRGQMVFDAVREAGGLTEDADADNINMVYSLNENVMLVIKSKKENKAVGEGAVVRSDSGPGAEVIGGGDDAANGRDDMRLVNINTAGVDELDTLPGIGEAKARDIIAYREKHGRFGRIEDIMKVPGIKQNRFESIKDFITVD
ncbi:MAG TPA: helix-hairpin-helix domain-containing protein [Clostridiales bacterium]|nr:helix-hairpin-helix domain-containing protein [Clostridiales bacterium]HOL90819.1 helix-hairpin-helix domain-containing protein [Clostridiales bacterium]HPP34749.1 helix-hairpin-helix domain-containing protein [Clostridiales bacterium]